MQSSAVVLLEISFRVEFQLLFSVFCILAHTVRFHFSHHCVSSWWSFFSFPCVSANKVSLEDIVPLLQRSLKDESSVTCKMACSAVRVRTWIHIHAMARGPVSSTVSLDSSVCIWMCVSRFSTVSWLCAAAVSVSWVCSSLLTSWPWGIALIGWSVTSC